MVKKILGFILCLLTTHFLFAEKVHYELKIDYMYGLKKKVNTLITKVMEIKFMKKICLVF